MKTKEERYNELLIRAEMLFKDGDAYRAEVALELCREIRLSMQHSWDEEVRHSCGGSMMTPESVRNALGVSRSAPRRADEDPDLL